MKGFIAVGMLYLVHHPYSFLALTTPMRIMVQKIDLRSRLVLVYLGGNSMMGFCHSALDVLSDLDIDVVAVINAEYAGKKLASFTGIPRQVPVVGSIEAAVALGADTLVIAEGNSTGLVALEFAQICSRASKNGLKVIKLPSLSMLPAKAM